MKSWSPITVALLVAATAALPYLTGLNHGWVYDDHGSIEENPFLREAGAARRVLTLQTVRDPEVLDGQRPALLASLLADRALWGDDPRGYHLTSAVLHGAVAALLFALVLRLSASPSAAAAAGLLFGLHPLAVEAVQMPSYREDLLCGFFVLAALCAGLSRRPRWALLAPPVCAFLAMTAKETALVLPFLFIWMWTCFPETRPSGRRAAGLFFGCLAPMVLFMAVGFAGRSLQAASGVWNGVSLRSPENLFTAPWLLLRYLRLLLWPQPLSVDYVIDPVPSLWAARALAGVVSVLFLLGMAWFMRWRDPLVAVGLGWLLLAFGPVSNLIPLFNPFAERYAYLMAMGFACALAGAVSALPRRTLLVGLVSLVYATFTLIRLTDFRDDATLWLAALRVEPRSARAHVWMGLQAKAEGDPTEARRWFEDAAVLNPQEASAAINLALLDGQGGRLQEAEQRLLDLLQRRPDSADAHWNLAVAYYLQDKMAEAEAEAAEAARLNPRLARDRAK